MPISLVVLPLTLPAPEWDIYADDQSARADYSPQEHAAWRARYNVLYPLWSQLAPDQFLDGLLQLSLDPSRVPRLFDINKIIATSTEYRAVGIDGPLPLYAYLNYLAKKTIPVARVCQLHALDNSASTGGLDVVHDLAAQVPWLFSAEYIQSHQLLARIGINIKKRLPKRPSKRDKIKLSSAATALKRVWHATFLRGLIKASDDQSRAFGTQVLTDATLLNNLASLSPARFDLATIINTPSSLTNFYIIDSLPQFATDLLDLERWLAAGRLDLLPGSDGELTDEDLKSFLSPNMAG